MKQMIFTEDQVARKVQHMIDHGGITGEVTIKDTDHRVGYEHKHDKPIINDYPTVGVPKPGEPFDFTPMMPEDFYGYEKQIATWFRPYNDTNCKYKRIGHPHDGGYVMCENFIPESEALINLGVENRDDFGCDFSSYRKVPNYMYDCTSRVKPECDKNNDGNKFYHTCVGDTTQYYQNSFETLKDMIDKNGLTNKHISLKMDVEGAEMVALRHLPTSYLEYIDQIVMEFHCPEPWLEEVQQWGFLHMKFMGNLQIWKTLSEHFYGINVHYTNNGCYIMPHPDRQGIKDQHWFRSSTIELSLVNKNLLKINKPTRSFQWSHKENAMNFDWENPNVVYCDYEPGVDPNPEEEP